MTKANNAVGYCRPPRHTQWPKGVSGNLAGRPKKRKNAYVDLVEGLLARELTITENGDRRQVTVFDAIVLQLLRKANAGNASARSCLRRYLAYAGQIPDYVIIPEMDRETALAIYNAMIAYEEP